MINFEHLRIFYYVAVNQNISHAAEQLFLSQPTVSNALKSFENSLGFSLFDRLPKGVKLTQKGFDIFNLISPAMQILINAENRISNIMNESRIFNVSCNCSAAEQILLPILQRFETAHPGIHVDTYEMSPHGYYISNALTNRQINCAVALRPVIPSEISENDKYLPRHNEDKHVKNHVLKHYETVAVAGSKFSALAAGQNLHFEDLEDHSFVFQTKKFFLRNGNPFDDTVLCYYKNRLCRTESQLARDIVISDRNDVFEFVRRDLGIAFAIKELAEAELEHHPGELFILPLDETLIDYEMVIHYSAEYNESAPEMELPLYILAAEEFT